MDKYKDYEKVFHSSRAPFAYIDLSLLDINIERTLLRAGDKKIRIATKSVRCLEVLKYLELKLGEKANGFMCYSAQEAIWLCENGLDNLLIAYPSLDSESIRRISTLTSEGKKIYLMVDSQEHVDYLEKLNLSEPLLLCLDMDLSTYLPGLNFGVFRSPLRGKSEFQKLLKRIKESGILKIKGLMGYEAQIAGVTDNQDKRIVMNIIISFLKKISLKKIPKIRESYLREIEKQNISLDFVNGGGTGSMESTRTEEGVTEIAVGSGFYSPTLFDSYKNFKYEPAAGFAIEIVRKPQENIYTCFAGGYVASGAVGVDKIPRPYLPTGCSLISNEMAGEVQTPVIYKGLENLGLGSKVYFRHAKAGELCERFNKVFLVRGEKVEREVNTYRGEGKFFG
ncbi:MAG: amino acid aldolase [Halobacteriovorax sp.]|nr:amino acid aldolase [Halobacteriovorax sp.]|tara:strand:+ start:225393 stop:226577 length:1185 start_codon:yes stop_codon:yes gene_type:complete